jgi:hypothetical protein
MQWERPNARLVYRIFNATLRPVLTADGYRRAARTQGTWAKPIGSGYLLVGVAASRWGWDELTGSTVEWQYGGSPVPTHAMDGSYVHISGEELYGDDLLLELQSLLRRFMTALPSIAEEQFYAEGRGNRSDWTVVSDMRRTPRLTTLQQLMSLPYYSPEHLAELADWLATHHATAEERAVGVLHAHSDNANR